MRWCDAVYARTDLAPATKLVAYRLARHMNVKTRQCNPSHATLAEGIGGANPRTIRAAIRELRDAGLIDVVAGKGSTSSRYELLYATDVPAVDEPARVTRAGGEGPQTLSVRVHRPSSLGSTDPPNSEVNSEVNYEEKNTTLSSSTGWNAAERRYLDRVAERLVARHASIVGSRTGRTPEASASALAAATRIVESVWCVVDGDDELALAQATEDRIWRTLEYALRSPYYATKVIRLDRFERDWAEIALARDGAEAQEIDRHGVDCHICGERDLPENMVGGADFGYGASYFCHDCDDELKAAA